MLVVIPQKKVIEILIYDLARSAVLCPIDYGYVIIIDYGSAPELSKMR